MSCFVDNGDLAVLENCSDPKCIVVGRTGTGKTALLKMMLVRQENSVELSPEDLSLNYLSNSTIIDFFEEAGVHLDLFYKLLWHHVITVELLRKKYGIENSKKQNDFLNIISGILRKDRAKERALKYLEEWGEHFWQETEYRVKEFATKLEEELKGSVGVELDALKLGAEGARSLSREKRAEVINRAKTVLDRVQISELHSVIKLLSEEIFIDPQQNFYIVIDRLDEGWVDDKIRFKLIKALIESIKSFKRVSNIKIIVSLRADLLHRVLKETQGAGFQEEKYRALYLQLRWKRPQLEELLNSRVNFLFERQYTKDNVFLKHILPTNQIERMDATEYILSRTFNRPREAILFLNECIEKAEGESRVSIGTLRSAEVTYSKQRLRSLGDEWKLDYPCLVDYTRILVRRPRCFRLESITDSELEEFAVGLLGSKEDCKDPVIDQAAVCYLNGSGSSEKFKEDLFKIFYRVGLIGVKTDTFVSRQWSYLDEPFLTDGQIKPVSSIEVHATFWAALGIVRQ